VSYYDRSPIRCATHGMSEAQARRWWADNAPPAGLYMRADVGPALPCDTLSSGRHNAGKKRRRGPTEYSQHNLGARTDIPIRDYYHQAGLSRGLQK